MMRVYLIRHGQTSWNISGKAQGHTDISLDPTGLEQAELLAHAFADLQVDQVLCSDLARAKETARPLAQAVGVQPEFRRDLRERTFGEWEGLPFGDVTLQLRDRAQRAGISAQQVRPPGGESFADVWERLDPIHDYLRRAEGNIVVVSHGGTLSLLAAKLICGTLDTCRAFRHSNTGVTTLERRDEGLFLITKYSDTAHLDRHRDGVAH